MVGLADSLFGMLDWEAFGFFFQVVLINLVLSGDNALIIGLAAAGLPPSLQKKAIFWGIAIATVQRLLFSLLAVHLLQVQGLTFLGGILLFMICWTLGKELLKKHQLNHSEQDKTEHAVPVAKKFSKALQQIIFADLSMSLDNVLAVAGLARDHTLALVFGLTLSIGLMALASTFIARLLQRYPWIGWLGLLVILVVATEMVIDDYSGFYAALIGLFA